jgi:hypothetical protein
MTPHRLRAPSVDGALLADPPLDEAVPRLAANSERLADWDHDFQGRRADFLRPAARRQALERAREYHRRYGLDVPELPDDPAFPLVVTGHQPELFHPGVWIKNFATAAIAREGGGLGLNLVVDDDIPKSSSIRVPAAEADGGLRVRRVDYDEWAGEVPFEDLKVRDESLFASFPDRVRRIRPPVVADPLLDDFWPRATAKGGLTDRPGLRFSLARRELEAAWGSRNFEVPLSVLCETETFLWFASHLLAQLPRFQQIHNEALAQYRRLYGIRSRHHPVPALGREGDWLEAPFWVWRDREPRRRPLLARQLARTMQLRVSGEETPLAEIPLSPDREACCAVEQLMELPAKGVRLRTRALTTTMFARYLLSDLFIHGIGGAKYDELGDAIAGRFFGIEPPSYLTMSLTLWLGLGTDPASPGRLEAVERRIRDLTYNPDRNLDPDGSTAPDVRRRIEAKRLAIAGPVATRAERRDRFRAIRDCNEALQDHVSAQRGELLREREGLRAGLRRNALAHHREYASVLHSASHLRAAFGRIVPGAFRA